jgi:hypothetical protein
MHPFSDASPSFNYVITRSPHDKWPLAFDPDALVAASTYDSATTVAFLSENAPPLFSDIGALARTIDVFSDVDVLLREDWGGRGSGGVGSGAAVSVSAELAAALAARSIAAWNSSPAPKSFRPTRRPGAFALARVAAANIRWVTDEALGVAGDIGTAAAHAALRVGAAGCLATTERITNVIPHIGGMLRAARAAPPTPARTALLGLFSARAEALLVAAATSFGSDGAGDTRDDGEEFSSVGGAPRAAWARGLTTGAAEENDDAPHRDVLDDDSVDGGAEKETSVSAALEQRPRVRIAGLQRGMWELRCAQRGVDIRRPTQFTNLFFPDAKNEGPGESDEIEDC